VFNNLTVVLLFILVLWVLWITVLLCSIYKMLTFLGLSVQSLKEMSDLTNDRVDNIFNLAMKQAAYANTLTDVMNQQATLVRAMYESLTEPEKDEVSRTLQLL